MNRAILALFCAFIFNNSVFATETDISSDNDFISADEILNRAPDDTPCATGVFSRALAESADNVSEYDDETVIQQWIYGVMSMPGVLQSVLECPEFQSLDETDHIKLQTIRYTFPGGREIVINYETQPTILKQRVALGGKRSVDDLNDPNPKIGTLDDTSIWTNTDPAWYAIMVVQHGSLDNFIGATKNNTVSLKYIEDNIERLYPSGAMCTSKTALASDSDIVNLALQKTVNVDEDTNDYYIAGDKNLQWISYAEIAADVVITVVTFGGGAVLAGVTKSARATRAMNGLQTTMRTLSKSPKVVEYIKLEQRVQRNTNAIARIKKYQQLEKELSKLDKVRDATKYADKVKEMEEASKTLREVYKLPNTAKYTDNIKDLEKESEALAKQMRNAAKADKEVSTYADASKSYSEIREYSEAYRNLKSTSNLPKAAKTGNIAARTWKAFRATAKGNKIIDRGARIARTSAKSGRLRDWLFNSTLRNAGTLAKLESAGGLLYGAIRFAGDMYDWTETSTGDFTSGIEFKPLLLASADDLQGQENVVNHGMWILWSGDSINAADDDAAYLQSMDFADKFHYNLISTMEEKNNHACDVDIYVVRPIIRNPGNNPQLYYLVMNDTPWTTAE